MVCASPAGHVRQLKGLSRTKCWFVKNYSEEAKGFSFTVILIINSLFFCWFTPVFRYSHRAFISIHSTPLYDKPKLKQN